VYAEMCRGTKNRRKTRRGNEKNTRSSRCVIGFSDFYVNAIIGGRWNDLIIHHKCEIKVMVM